MTPQTSPSDVVNRSLDLLGAPAIGDIYEGSTEARPAIRQYGPTIRDVLRAANWNFARKQEPLILVNDATMGMPVPTPWLYEYLYPVDCVKLRYVPQLTGLQTPLTPPLMTSLGQPLGPAWAGQSPAPHVVATDLTTAQWGVFPWGTVNWAATMPASFVIGGPTTVILCNVAPTPNPPPAGTTPAMAQAVYTAMIANPELWDPLFMETVIAFLTARLAMAVMPDKKMAMTLRGEQIQMAKMYLGEARAQNGNETWTTQDHMPDWIRIRGAGGYPWGFWNTNIPGGAGVVNDAFILGVGPDLLSG